jgi:hypothetical protein
MVDLVFTLLNEEEMLESPELQKQKSSARHLQVLFAIVAGLALTEAVSELAREVDNALPTARTLMLMVAFLATIIPFFHGALRHLDDVYIVTPPGPNMSRYALLIDFILLFVESVMLLGMAHRLVDPPHFLAFLLFLLVIDIIWAIVTPPLIDCKMTVPDVLQAVVPRPKFSKDTEIAWAQNNILFVPIAIAAWILIDTTKPSMTVDALIVMAFAVARSVNDYRLSWSFYFPTPETTPVDAPTLVPSRAPAAGS